jgi:hypothetical protein
MLRRSSRLRQVLMEPLEFRCNLSVIDPLAEPVQVPCDVVETGTAGTFVAIRNNTVGMSDDGQVDVASNSGGGNSSEASGADCTPWSYRYPTD